MFETLLNINLQSTQLSNGFNDPTLQEAVRIVPMRLRVSHYTAARIPEFPHRPTIHLEGETAGPAGTTGIRRIRGTVQMISDGSIRWTLVSCSFPFHLYLSA